MSEPRRPASIPFDSELARRADAPRYLPERIASTVMYHAGPEIGVTTIVGGVGALVIHPAALPIVAAVTAVYAAVDRITRARHMRPSQPRTAADTPTSRDQTSRGVDADEAADDHTEEIA